MEAGMEHSRERPSKVRAGLERARHPGCSGVPGQTGQTWPVWPQEGPNARVGSLLLSPSHTSTAILPGPGPDAYSNSMSPLSAFLSL